MLKIVLLGTGNIATHLFNVLNNANNVNVIQVYGRNKEALKAFSHGTETVTQAKDIKNAEIYLIAVSDDAIAPVSKLLKEKKGLIVHTSGSMPMDAIGNHRKGVFYLLQTFTKGKAIDFSNVPICIEAEIERDYLVLEQLGKSLSNVVHRISSHQRKQLHLSAVWANNFPNHLYAFAKEICDESGLPFKLLLPLISETVDKLRFLSPLEAQTGPARRNDIETMQSHIEQLKDPLQKKIYQLLSESIKTTYEKKL